MITWLMPFCNAQQDVRYIAQIFGMYDEPGVVGTIAGAILMTRQFNFKKWINIPIFIAGILSFSLFFYVILQFT